MKAIVHPSEISGTITAPASKSAMQRACAAALLAKGETHLYNYGISNDDKAALEIIQCLGADVAFAEEKIMVRSNGIQPKSHEINCGESGLSFRMFTSIAALSEQPVTINGSGSLVKRPQAFFSEVLPQLGVKVQSHNGFLPLQIQGPLQPQNITIDGSLSSQFLTGLLFAYSASNANGVTIRVKNLNSKPYIDLTLKVLYDFGLPVPENNQYQSFHFKKSIPSVNHATRYTVESDWSGAAFVLVAGAIAGNIVVKGLDVFSAQADKAILQALMQAGVNMSITPEEISINAPLGNRGKAFQFNATDCPDLFPPLVALAAYCEGTSVVEGVRRLAHKESNRALTLQEEFGKLGVEITLQDDLMLVKGSTIKGGKVYAHHDHRIAMACAVAALKANDVVEIDGADAVNKSYPQFWEHLQKLSATLSLENI